MLKIYKKSNFNKLLFYDLCNFYKLQFISIDEIINCNIIDLMHYVINGDFNYKNHIDLEFKYKNYIQNWFYVWNKYREDELYAALSFYISLDKKESITIKKWYLKHTHIIKFYLKLNLMWWLNKRQHNIISKKIWNIFLVDSLPFLPDLFFYLENIKFNIFYNF